MSDTATKFEEMQEAEIRAPKHYNNENGSLYLFCSKNNLNAWEFDAIKRIMRCRKKGNFIEDINKTIFLLELYKEEFKEDKGYEVQ